MCAANQIWCGACSLRDAIGVVATGTTEAKKDTRQRRRHGDGDDDA